MRAARPAGAVLLAAVLLSACEAREDEGAPRLAIRIDELCTRCVEVLRCTGESHDRVYVLDEKSAGAQMATIFDYLRRPISPKKEDRRPLHAFTLSADGTAVRDARGEATALLRLDARVIVLPDSSVDQRSGAWRAASGASVGTCEHLPPAAGRELARSLSSHSAGAP